MTASLLANSNHFSGFLPSQLGALTAMKGYFHFNSNSFSGELPSQVLYCLTCSFFSTHEWVIEWVGE
jgi:hypothetical protein